MTRNAYYLLGNTHQTRSHRSMLLTRPSRLLVRPQMLSCSLTVKVRCPLHGGCSGTHRNADDMFTPRKTASVASSASGNGATKSSSPELTPPPILSAREIARELARIRRPVRRPSPEASPPPRPKKLTKGQQAVKELEGALIVA